ISSAAGAINSKPGKHLAKPEEGWNSALRLTSASLPTQGTSGSMICPIMAWGASVFASVFEWGGFENKTQPVKGERHMKTKINSVGTAIVLACSVAAGILVTGCAGDRYQRSTGAYID